MRVPPAAPGAGRSAANAGRADRPAARPDPGAWASAAVAAAGADGLRRRPRHRVGGSGPVALVDGREAIVLSSNDYLGLSVHPAVRRAAAHAATERGAGSTGSRHLSGCHAAIDALEASLAGFEGAATATLAPSGYQANLAALTALGGGDAVVLSDERNHASIIDGARLSRARVEVYRHGDLDDLDARLARCEGRPVVVSDAVFSVDGDVADVAGLAALAQRHGAWLVLDEAHATGVLGATGRGAAEAAGIAVTAPWLVRVVTLSKALGSAGGAVLGSAELRDLLLLRGRALIFSTAPPPAAIAAASAALEILRDDPNPLRRLRGSTAWLRGALAPLRPGGRADIPILPLMIGSATDAVAVEARLLDAGVLVQAVRPPTVPHGTSRLRVAVSAALTDTQLETAAGALLEVLSA